MARNICPLLLGPSVMQISKIVECQELELTDPNKQTLTVIVAMKSNLKAHTKKRIDRLYNRVVLPLHLSLKIARAA